MNKDRQEKVTILDNCEVEGMKLMRASYRNQTFRRHSHDGYGFGIVARGTLCFRYLGVDHYAPPGMINLVCPGECHDGHGLNEEGWSYRMFYITPELMMAIIGDCFEKHTALPFFRTGVIEDGALARQLMRSHRYIMENAGDNLGIEESISDLIAGLVRTHAEEKIIFPGVSSGATRIQRVIEKLEDEYNLNHRLEHLALLAGYSKYHFLRVFKKHTGLTPHNYLNQIRTRRSEQMIRAGLELSDIAFCAGFSDQSHFTRTFKSIIGVPPGLYRNFVQDVDN